MARTSDRKKLVLWQDRLRRFLGSDLAVVRFCAVEQVSESSFYYWQKKLGPQTPRRRARAKDCDTRAKDRDTGAKGRDTGVAHRDSRAKGRDTRAKDGGVFRPVAVVPATCGVVVRLPGGTRIDVDADALDAIRAVLAETVRVDHDEATDRDVSSGNPVIRGRGGAASC